ncbi:Uncharacterized protein Fot_06298 [Forsythia ovata]|uniref:Uncharacterized protein n=1 Tax=Forsythia ovata TaxID=205694 RepID=A0ABD1WSQ0_9LAMI
MNVGTFRLIAGPWFYQTPVKFQFDGDGWVSPLAYAYNAIIVNEKFAPRLMDKLRDHNHLLLAHLFDKPCFLGLLVVKDTYVDEGIPTEDKVLTESIKEDCKTAK